MVQEFSIPLATLARYVKKKRDLIEQGSSMLPSVVHKGCNAVFTVEYELKLQSYVRKAATLYFWLPPKQVHWSSKVEAPIGKIVDLEEL